MGKPLKPAAVSLDSTGAGSAHVWDVSAFAMGTVTFSCASWSGGVVTLKRSNSQNGPWSALETPVTVSADGTTETLDLQAIAYLRAEITTQVGAPVAACLFGLTEAVFRTPITGIAPVDAQYLVGAADSTLTAERVVTDTATVTWDLSVAGQASASAATASDQFILPNQVFGQ